MTLNRRTLAALAASSLAAPAIVSRAAARGQRGGARVQAAVARFAALPSASDLVVADHPTAP